MSDFLEFSAHTFFYFNTLFYRSNAAKFEDISMLILQSSLYNVASFSTFCKMM